MIAVKDAVLPVGGTSVTVTLSPSVDAETYCGERAPLCGCGAGTTIVEVIDALGASPGTIGTPAGCVEPPPQLASVAHRSSTAMRSFMTAPSTAAGRP